MRKLIVVVLLAICPVLFAQQVLNNEGVIKLVKAGLSEDLISATVSGSPGSYDSSTDGLIALKAAGVSDKVVAAIVVKANTPAPVPAAAAAAASAAPDAPPAPPFRSTDGKIRIYVTDRPLAESTGIVRASGNRHGASAAGVSHSQAGDDPRTVEVQANMVKVCPAHVIASNNPNRADYILVFRRHGGTRSSMFAFGGLAGLALSAAMKVDGASLFESTGDMVYATRQTTVEKSIKDICEHIPARPSAPASAAVPATDSSAAPASAAASTPAAALAPASTPPTTAATPPPSGTTAN